MTILFMLAGIVIAAVKNPHQLLFVITNQIKQVRTFYLEICLG